MFPRAYQEFFWVKILKFFDVDPGWKNSDPPGCKNLDLGSATLLKSGPGPVLKEGLYDGDVSDFGGEVEGGGAAQGARVGLRSLLQQVTHHALVTL
jgi:hypothetical protein